VPKKAASSYGGFDDDEATSAPPPSAPIGKDNVWEKQQTKAFTAWVNSHLKSRDIKLVNIQTDLCDGVALIALMEVVGSTEEVPLKLARPSKGKMRIHKIQNLNVALDYMNENGVRLIGIGAEEICDGNLKLILGCIWTIILRFDIQNISEDAMSAKDALLLWCQRKTKSYQNVEIKNFHKSWQNGRSHHHLTMMEPRS
jgi:actinin alpha